MTEWVEEDDVSWTLRLEAIGTIGLTKQAGFWVVLLPAGLWGARPVHVLARDSVEVSQAQAQAERAVIGLLDETRAELEELRK